MSIRTVVKLIGATFVASAIWLVAGSIATENRAHAMTATLPQGDACSLITKQEAEAAMGEAVTGSKAMSNLESGVGPLSSCQFAGSSPHQVNVNLTRLSASAVPMYKGMCSKKASKDLSGLGDVACWYNEKHEELHAMKGTNFLSVELQRSGDPTEVIKGVMKKALERVK